MGFESTIVHGYMRHAMVRWQHTSSSTPESQSPLCTAGGSEARTEVSFCTGVQDLNGIPSRHRTCQLPGLVVGPKVYFRTQSWNDNPNPITFCNRSIWIRILSLSGSGSGFWSRELCTAIAVAPLLRPESYYIPRRAGTAHGEGQAGVSFFYLAASLWSPSPSKGEAGE